MLIITIKLMLSNNNNNKLILKIGVLHEALRVFVKVFGPRVKPQKTRLQVNCAHCKWCAHIFIWGKIEFIKTTTKWNQFPRPLVFHCFNNLSVNSLACYDCTCLTLGHKVPQWFWSINCPRELSEPRKVHSW